MKTSSIHFAQLRKLLLDLQFTEKRSDSYWRFEEPHSETVFLFRPYAVGEYVNMPDVVSTRTHLDWRGLLSSDAFDEALTKPERSAR
jgi:hypothetical protein